MIRVKELLHVEPFKLLCRWSNDEVRINDLTQEVGHWEKSQNQELAQLANPDKFKTAFAQNGTVAFAGILVDVDDMGSQPLDLDPDTLFDTSKKVGQFLDVPVY